MRFLYDFIFVIFAAVYLPYYFLVRRKGHPGFAQRWGRLSDDVRAALPEGHSVWAHAVSVGEVQVIAGLIRQVKSARPDCGIVLTTVTPTGQALAKRLLDDEAVIVFAPLDFSWIVRRYLDWINPDIYLTAETEIWPNLWTELSRRNIPVALVNGRLSDRSFGQYKIVRPLLRRVLKTVQVCAVQTPVDAERFVDLGVLPERVTVTGNMKFDDLPSESAGPPLFDAAETVWVAGSTHPGEEDIVLKAYRKLRKDYPRLRLVVAPRHVERIQDIASLAEWEGESPLYYSLLVDRPRPLQDEGVILVDTIGHLRQLYQFADIVFIGKSLCGRGGQNLIEPAFFGKPVIMGPHMENFARIAALFREAGAALQIDSATDLAPAVAELLTHPVQRQAMGEAGRDVIARHRGATAKSLALVLTLLP